MALQSVSLIEDCVAVAGVKEIFIFLVLLFFHYLVMYYSVCGL